MSLSAMQQSDLETVIDVHINSFKGFFLTFLGPAFLRELYKGIMLDPSGIAIVYVDHQRVIGFVAGTTEPAGFYKRLIRKRLFRFGYASLLSVLREPEIVPRLIRAFRKPFQDMSLDSCATLMSIAVHPDNQFKGVGKVLLRAFLMEAKRRGSTKVNLTTDQYNNDSVNRFYQNFGFRCARQYITPEGRPMNEYVVDLLLIERRQDEAGLME